MDTAVDYYARRASDELLKAETTRSEYLETLHREFAQLLQKQGEEFRMLSTTAWSENGPSCG